MQARVKAGYGFDVRAFVQRGNMYAYVGVPVCVYVCACVCIYVYLCVCGIVCVRVTLVYLDGGLIN